MVVPAPWPAARRSGGDGELGNGSVADSATPVRVLIPAGLAVTAVAAGPAAGHSLAIVHKAVAAAAVN
jgi:hypothetical protein